MRTERELRAAAAIARVEELKAKDQGLLSGHDTTGAREFAAGVEAGLLWALGDIGVVPFPVVEHVRPSGNDGLDVDDLPGISGETPAAGAGV